MVKGAQRPMASAEAKGAHLVVGWVGPSSSPSSAPATSLQVGARALHTGFAERSIAAVLCHRATLPAQSALCGAAARAAAAPPPLLIRPAAAAAAAAAAATAAAVSRRRQRAVRRRRRRVLTLWPLPLEIDVAPLLLASALVSFASFLIPRQW